MIELREVSKTSCELLELIELLDAYLNSRYGSKQQEYNQYNKLDNVDVALIACENGVPVGCGCYKKFDSHTVEIKRMFVRPDFRGKGIAQLILSKLEEKAKLNGFTESVLETGTGQPEAVRFYIKSGYTKTANYGQYAGNSNSVCMVKELFIHES